MWNQTWLGCLAALAVIAGLTGLATLSGCATGAGSVAKSPGAVSTRAVSLRSPGTPHPSAHPSPRPTPTPTATPARKPDPLLAALPVAPPQAASEPQTNKLPDTSSTAFKNVVHDLWLAVTTGRASYARPAFFPEKAYAQVKAIGDPDGDWQNRLWYDFTLDLAAAHQLVQQHARLETVLVAVNQAAWIPAGACYNTVGYWHVSDSRVVYRSGGATHSFGIASFISWRGDWYVIHFGAVVRSGAYGVIDDPEAGPGIAGPTANC
jgi:hypothetical protein